MAEKKLTQKQQAFADLYDGNGTETCRKAGYKGSDNVLAVTATANLRNHKILTILLERQALRSNDNIASREERQEFWTNVMRGDEKETVILHTKDGDDVELQIPARIAERLKAAEMLGKSEGDFVDRVAVEFPDGPPVWRIEFVNPGEVKK